MIKKDCFCNFSIFRNNTKRIDYNLGYLVNDCDKCFYERSDGTFEAIVKFDEIDCKVKCKCGKYMKTHLHEHSLHDQYGNVYGKSHYEIIAACNCENPEPDIMECPSTEPLDIALENAVKALNKVQILINEKEIFG